MFQLQLKPVFIICSHLIGSQESSFRREPSKRDKREAKKEEKLRKLKSRRDAGRRAQDADGHAGDGAGHDGAQAHPKGSVAEKLYTGTVRSSTEFLSLSATSDLQDIQS